MKSVYITLIIFLGFSTLTQAQNVGIRQAGTLLAKTKASPTP
jgi:hypothetical protein